VAIDLEQARLKHGIHEAIALRSALEAIADRKKRKALEKAVPDSDWGAYNSASNGALDLFTAAMPAGKMGSLHFDSVVLPLDATAVPLKDGFRMYRVSELHPPAEESQKLHRLKGLIKRWNEEVDKRLEGIKRDKGLPNALRRRVAAEILEHSNRINTLAQKIGEEKFAFVQRAAREAEEARKTPEQRRAEAALKRKEAKFNKILSELERDPLKGKDDPRALGYAKRLFEAHPLHVLEVMENAKPVPANTRAWKGGASELIDPEEPSGAAAWNVKSVFENEEFRKFIKRERAKEIKKWKIEPFPEGNRLWREARKKLKRHGKWLKSKGISGDEFKKKYDEKHWQLTVSVTDAINDMLHKQGKRLVLFDRKMFKLPERLAEKITKEMPPVLHFNPAGRKAERKMLYHA